MPVEPSNGEPQRSHQNGTPHGQMLSASGIGSASSPPRLSTDLRALPFHEQLLKEDPIDLLLMPRILPEIANGIPELKGPLAPAESARFSSALQMTLSSRPFIDYIRAVLSPLVAWGPDRKPFARRAVAWVVAGDQYPRLALGVEVQHGNPPQWGGAEFGAAAVLVGKGYRDRVIAAIALDACPGRAEVMSDASVGVLRRHVDPRVGDCVVMGLRTDSSAVWMASLNAVRPSLSFAPEVVAPIAHPLRAPVVDLPLVWRLREQFDPRNPDPAVIQSFIDQILTPSLRNNTTVGAPPATKGHSALVIAGDLVILGTNHRDGSWPDQVRCAEFSATMVAETAAAVRQASWPPRWQAAMVCSDGYMLRSGTLGLPTVCAPCLGVQGEHADESLPERMLLIRANTLGQYETHNLSDVLPHCYSAADALVLRGPTQQVVAMHPTLKD